MRDREIALPAGVARVRLRQTLGDRATFRVGFESLGQFTLSDQNVAQAIFRLPCRIAILRRCGQTGDQRVILGCRGIVRNLDRQFRGPFQAVLVLGIEFDRSGVVAQRPAWIGQAADCGEFAVLLGAVFVDMAADVAVAFLLQGQPAVPGVGGLGRLSSF